MEYAMRNEIKNGTISTRPLILMQEYIVIFLTVSTMNRVLITIYETYIHKKQGEMVKKEA